MTTAAQITANQNDVQFSTGRVIPGAKARVSQNALRHGLTAGHLVIRTDEGEEFESLQQSRPDELAPHEAIETVTFHDSSTPPGTSTASAASRPKLMPGSPDDFSSASPNTAAAERRARYQARTHCAWYRALKELRTLQTNRTLRSDKLEDPDALEKVPAIPDINELTKQTHSEVVAEGMKEAIQMVDFEDKMLVQSALRARCNAPVPRVTNCATSDVFACRRFPARYNLPKCTSSLLVCWAEPC